MKRLRFVAFLFMLASVLLVGPARAAGTFTDWETHAANCVTSGGTVDDAGRCGGGLYFYNCYDPTFADACFDYCLGGVESFGDGGTADHWCHCLACGG